MVGALGAIALLAAAASGCGGSSGYANAARPPAMQSISISVFDARVDVSPTHIGAGPIVLLIANESTRSRDVTLRGASGGRACVGADASSGPINPQSTARVQLALVEGSCEVGVAGGGPAPARLVVGHERPSAQQDLLQP
ncbi:MAG TPA: hypothetical protein VFV85_00690 [Conexibacter sp.]|nr:hypothetical protein [Conexibacter sp.]